MPRLPPGDPGPPRNRVGDDAFLHSLRVPARARGPGKIHDRQEDSVPTLILKDIPAELHRAAKVRAAQEGITLKALILKAVEEYLARAEEKGGGR